MTMYFMRRYMRKHKVILGAIILLTALYFVASVMHIRQGRDDRDTDKIYSIEKRREHCGVAICTPCQSLEVHETDTPDSHYSTGFHDTLHKTFPPATTKKLETLPTSGIDRIEKIIHQSWKSNDVPVPFINYIQSFIKNHPSWQYMFWTDRSMRIFLKDHHPNLLSLYDNYPHPLNRPDAMRYVLLFHYGGVYSDLDIQNLHPLDPMIKKYPCFLGQEPHAHSIIYSNFYEQASNAFMACRKQHPFMKYVIDNLSNFYYFSDVLDSTGPRFLTFSFRQYISQNKALVISNDDYVYLAPPEYFLPTVDPEMNDKLKYLCDGFSCLSALRRWQCAQWKEGGLESKPYSFSFTNHVWAHTAYNIIYSLSMQTIDIFRMVPNATQYHSHTLGKHSE